MQVTKDKVVILEYTMNDDEGHVIDTTDDGEPLSFIQGRGNLLPAIEAAIEGHEMGQRMTITLKPDQAYGERNENLISKVPRDHVKVPGELKIGLELSRQNGSRIMPITVVAFDDESVTLDANNPLAGTTLSIDLVVVEVRNAVDEELKSGKVQSMEERNGKKRVDGTFVEFKL